jgi:hypothetical protein
LPGKLLTLTPDDPPVIRRLRIVLGQLAAFSAKNKTSRYSRFSWVLDSMMDEVLSEIADNGDVDTMEEWMINFGKVVEWCGSGDVTILPEGIRDYLRENHPQELLAIEA